MKAAEFDYRRAADLDEVCRLLADGGEDAKIIAGGQTLVPLMAMRMARPSLLVDINHVAELQGIEADDKGVVLRAGTRQETARRDSSICRQVPLLTKALGFLGHLQIRHRGTIGGSLANADPAAEIGLAALTLDAEIAAFSTAGERWIPAANFFLGTMVTALEQAECLSRVRFPRQCRGLRCGTGFQEVSIRRGDFALASAAVSLRLDRDGTCRHLAAAVGGVEATPVRVDAAAAPLIGTRPDEAAIAQAGRQVAEAVEPQADLHASADYRRRLAGELFVRALREAMAEAAEPIQAAAIA